MRKTKARKPAYAKGDCNIMLEILRLRTKGVKLDPSNPERQFRGLTELEADMVRVLGTDQGLQITKWGASHLRGGFRDDERRGNKRHIIAFIKAVNAWSGESQDLQRVYEQAIREHHVFWSSQRIEVAVQSEDDAKARLLKVLQTPSQGQIQQGIVYALLRIRHPSARVTTKGTFAGDAQSEIPGDVQVWRKEGLSISVEVKDCKVDPKTWQRVENTHGHHEYPLLLLAREFEEEVYTSLLGRSQTFPVHLLDFCVTELFSAAVDSGEPPMDLFERLVSVYNEEFCLRIARDGSIRIALRVE